MRHWLVNRFAGTGELGRTPATGAGDRGGEGVLGYQGVNRNAKQFSERRDPKIAGLFTHARILWSFARLIQNQALPEHLTSIKIIKKTTSINVKQPDGIFFDAEILIPLRLLKLILIMKSF